MNQENIIAHTLPKSGIVQANRLGNVIKSGG
uniref:Uncharacterized protein n=2 Tax=Neisseria meningitidis TaxID=487 RepID=I4E3F6_NEIME|nr:hypothetical protein predicted by Glimmer/Critica [Neisseria meningitidis alpha153]CCA43870.1 hypothetical protein NMALPHA522_0329 [Neisseria meningitidis alpha522]